MLRLTLTKARNAHHQNSSLLKFSKNIRQANFPPSSLLSKCSMSPVQYQSCFMLRCSSPSNKIVSSSYSTKKKEKMTKKEETEPKIEEKKKVEKKNVEKEEIRRLVLLPMFGHPLMPGTMSKVQIDNETYERINKEWKEKEYHMTVATFLSKSSDSKKITDLSQLYSMGCEAQCTEFVARKEGGYEVTLLGLQRISLHSSSSSSSSASTSISNEKEEEKEKEEGRAIEQQVEVRTEKTEEIDPKDVDIRAYHHQIVTMTKELQNHPPFARPEVLFDRNSDPGKAADVASALAVSDPIKCQQVLETLDVKERQAKVLFMLKMEESLIQMSTKLGQQVDDDVSKSNRQYFLKQQMKHIKKELGMEEDKSAMIEKFQERLKELNVPEAVMKVIKEEMNKLSGGDQHSSESNVTRNYLEWLTCLPWGKFNSENLDISNAELVLNEDHFGLKDVKERILEFIAVGKLRSGVQGKILCFVGPPGVGKTSIGKSIARALNRQFYRFSVGGMSDVAEIKGHRRTYIGAMPGKIIQCLKSVKSSNPVIMIDEIDKLGKGHQGDPASALLEVLDPEQNNAFLDHYLDVPFDISKVLFVVTANTKDTIPLPLLDRMEVVNLSGYVLEEKYQIASKYLIPNALKETGLPKDQISFKKEAVHSLIANWCRESGVRNLQKHIEKILRKIAFKVVKENKLDMQSISQKEDSSFVKTEPSIKLNQVGEKPGKSTESTRITEKIVVDESSLVSYVGKPVFNSDRYYERTPVGVVMGLAWTRMGGATLYIETVADRLSNKGGIRITGQVGDVMKESSEIALTYAKSFLESVQAGNRFFETATLHMHVPEGSTPKDGPSAGVTMVSSLLSLALQRPIKHDVAMTGELTLTGKVLPIGGVKEKTIAARRSGVKTIIFPKENEKDWDELEDYIKKGLNPHFADYYQDVFDVVFEKELVHESSKESSSMNPNKTRKRDPSKKKNLPIVKIEDSNPTLHVTE